MEDIRAIVQRLQATQGLEQSQSAKEYSEWEKEQQKKMYHSLENRGILKRFRDVTFGSMKTIPAEIRDNAVICRDYAKNIGQHIREDGQGLILQGTYGTMKSTLAVCILREALDQGYTGLFAPMCSLMDNLFTMRSLNREEWAKYEMTIRKTGVLILDDFGGENTDQGWILSKIDSIITERYNRMLPTIITTNYSLQDMAGTYSGRLMDRLMSTNRILSFQGHSRRKHLA